MSLIPKLILYAAAFIIITILVYCKGYDDGYHDSTAEIYKELEDLHKRLKEINKNDN